MSAIKTKAMGELLDALERAGVPQDAVDASEGYEIQVINAETGKTLAFEVQPEGTIWLCMEWWAEDDGSWTSGDESWAEHPEEMVAKVVEFLGEGA